MFSSKLPPRTLYWLLSSLLLLTPICDLMMLSTPPSTLPTFAIIEASMLSKFSSRRLPTTSIPLLSTSERMSIICRTSCSAKTLMVRSSYPRHLNFNETGNPPLYVRLNRPSVSLTVPWLPSSVDMVAPTTGPASSRTVPFIWASEVITVARRAMAVTTVRMAILTKRIGQSQTASLFMTGFAYICSIVVRTNSTSTLVSKAM